MKKKIIAKLLIFIIVCSIFPFNMFSYGETVYERIARLKEYTGNIEEENLLINATEIIINDIYNYLIWKGTEPESKKGTYKLNPYVYQKYKRIAYTPQSDINNKLAGLSRSDSMKNEKIGNNGFTEYRYLGYDYSEEPEKKLENGLFPADAKASNPKLKNWVTNSENRETWNGVKDDTNLENYILRKYLLDNGWTDFRYSFSDALQHLGITTNDQMKEYVKVINLPSFSAEGQFRMQHKRSNGVTWYGVTNRDRFDFDVEGGIDLHKTSYKIPPDKKELEVDYTLKAAITNLIVPHPGSSKETDTVSDPTNYGKYFRKITLTSMEEEIELFKNTDLKKDTIPSLNRKLKVTFDVGDIEIGESKNITLRGTISVECSDGYADTVDFSKVITVERVGECTPDFFVYRMEEDVTDGNISTRSLSFLQPETLVLKDDSYSEDGVVSRFWSVYSNVEKKWKNFHGTESSETVNVDITQANKEAYVKDGEIKFKMVLRTNAPITEENGELPFVIHNVKYVKATIPEGSGEGSPVAVIKANADYDNAGDCYRIMAGKSIRLNGKKSYHTAGLEIVDYNFNPSSEAYTRSVSKKSQTVYYLKTGKYPVKLTVTDENGKTDTDTTAVRVINPEFLPKIECSGVMKENRRVGIKVENEHNLYGYPVDESSITWEITPLDGQGNTVRIRNGANNKITGQKEIETLFKKKGRYRVKVSGYIRAIREGYRSYYGETEEIITIKEDYSPDVNFTISKKLLRDIDNENITEIKLYDKSRSIDGDYIATRNWYYYYDTDNDGSFSDETLRYFYGGNERKVSLQVQEVGKYKFELVAIEEFGQETLHEFVTADDRRRNGTLWNGKDEEEKICEIRNTAPVVEIEAKVNKKINLIIYTDYTEEEKVIIEDELTTLRKNLAEKKIDLTVKYLEGTKQIGTYDRLNIKYNQYVRFPYMYVPHYAPSRKYQKSYFQTINETINIWDDDLSNGKIEPSNKGTFPATIYPMPNYDTEAPYGGYCDREYFGIVEAGGINKSGFSDIFYLQKSANRIQVAYTSYGNSSGFNGKNYFRFNDQAVLGDYEFAGVNSTEQRPLKTIDLSTFENSLENTTDNNYFLSICKSDKGKIGFSKELKEQIKDNNVIYRSTEQGFSKSNPLNIKTLSDAKELNDNIYFIADGDYYCYEGTVNKIIKITKQAYEGIQIEKRTSSEDQVLNNFSTTHFNSNYSRAIIPSTDYANYDWDYKKRIYEPENDFRDINNIFKVAYIGNNGITGLLKEMEINIETNELIFFKRFLGKRLSFGENYNYTKIRDIYEKKVTENGYKGYKDTKDYRLFLADNGSLHTYNYKANECAYLKIWGDSHLIYKSDIYKDQDINIGTSSYTDLAFVNGDEGSNKITLGTKDGIVYEYDLDTRKYTRINLDIKEVLDSGAILLNDGATCYYDGKYFPNARYILVKGNINFAPNYQNRMQKNYYYFSITPANELYVTTYSDQEGYTPQTKTYKVADNVKKILTDGVMASKERVPLVYEDMEGNICRSAIEINYDHYSYPQYTFSVFISVKSYGNYERTTINDNPAKFLTLKDGKLYTVDLSLTGVSSIDYEYIGTEYATLSGIDYKTLVGENEIINISPKNRVYEKVEEVINSIYLDHKDYSTSSKLYVVLGEEFELNTIYSDRESDPLYEKKYSQIHSDPNYFENSLGKDPSISENIKNPRLKFDYVGKYQIYPHVRDNPKDDDRFDNYRLWNQDKTKVDVYVHRKPVALMTMKYEPYGDKYKVTFEDNGSYDLDRLSQYNKGISSYEFSIKAEDENFWEVFNRSKFTKYDIEKNKKYNIAYRVRDREGVWSDYTERELYLDDNPIEITAKVKPELNKFTVMSLPITERFKVYDIESKYNGNLKIEASIYGKNKYSGKYNQLIGEKKTYDKNLGSILLYVPDTVADVETMIKVRASDENNSGKYKEIEFPSGIRTPINLEPEMDREISSSEEIKITCKTSKYTGKVKLSLYEGTMYEKDYDMIKVSEDRDRAYWEYNYKVEEHIPDGEYKALFTGIVETRPKKEEKAYLNYKVNNLSITEAIIWGSWNHWRGQIDYRGKRLENNPLRFLSYEKIHFEVKTKGIPERVYVRLSPELEAMRFTDPYGNEYSYREHIGYEVEFPIELKKDEGGKWTGEYILPLAKSTISWEEKRKVNPYWVKITAEKGKQKEDFIFSKENGNGIEITGNTLDLVIPQPIE